MRDCAILEPIIAAPARNEAERLPILLQALAAQTWLETGGRRLKVVININNSIDGSAALLRRLAPSWPMLDMRILEVDLPHGQAHVGFARRMAMDAAFGLLSSTSAGVILTTDADARPGPTWVQATLAAISSGADAVGGQIIGDPVEEAAFGAPFQARASLMKNYHALVDRLSSLIDPLDHDPWPHHHDYTGASLAVRATAYESVGGLPEIPVREDLALVARLRRAGYRLRRPMDVRVVVSARLDGRAEMGMASCLRDWLDAEQAGLPLMVEDVDSIVDRLVRRQMIRNLGNAAPAVRASAAARLGVDGNQLAALLSAGANSISVVEHFAPDTPDAAANMRADVAVMRLETLVQRLEGQHFAA